jgi:predicted patatin/cPLA2 family phospholipase
MIAMLLPGCCSSRQCTAPTQTETKYSFDPQHRSEDGRYLRDALRFRPTVQPEHVDMLVLSGGGSHGAWGAGVLRGWRENRDNPRPTFRVVTGVSTGALLATYAFLGEDTDDETLERAYTTVRTKDIYRNKFLPFALFSDSFKSAAPLEHTIAKYVDTNTLERVAQAAKGGRRLYVGTANLDTGKLVIWDLTRIAADESNPTRLQLYRKVVYASACIPIAVAPVDIDGNLYSDGGVRAQLFFDKHFIPGVRDLVKESGSAAPQLMVHVIVNGQLGVQTNCVCDCLTDLSFTKGIVPRTLDMLLDANANGDLYRVDDLCRAINAGRRMCWIPDDYKNLYPSDEFDPKQMKPLYDAGRTFGKSNNKWFDSIPSP